MAIYNGGLNVKNVSVSTSGNGNAITSLTADGNVITATKGSFTPKRENGYSYNNLASYYAGGTNYGSYIRITVPKQSATWTMCTLEISLKQNYSSGFFGKILFHGNWSSSAEWNTLYANVYGRLSTDIKLYTSDKTYIYIAGCGSYCTCTVDKMLIGDNATVQDLSNVVMDSVNELPADYQTVTMAYEINSSNIGNQSVLKANRDSEGNIIKDTYLKLSGGTLTGDTTFKRYLKINAWDGYGTGSADFWYDGNNKSVDIQNVSNLKLSGVKVSKEDHAHNYAGSSSAGGPATSANWLNMNDSLTYGASGLQYYNNNTSITSGADKNANPTSDWYHIIRMNHGNKAGYFADIAVGFHNNYLGYRRIAYGEESGWFQCLDSSNYTSYVPTKTGSGASGTWGINITGSSVSCTGNAATATLASQSNQIKTTAATNNRAYYLSFTDAAATYNNLYTNASATYNPGTGVLKAPAVEGAVCNDLADSIPVDENCNLEHGYCYCFDGEKYYKSSKYLDNGIIGIHSDTFGFRMGAEEDKKKMDVAVSGFVLAYVDKEYPVGTPLTCTENGYLTEIELEDKMKYPEKIVATYWKNEPAEEWGLDNKKVKVNGRKWVKIK